MNRKTSAHYQREYRKRLREQGLVKKEIWIKPSNTAVLSEVEKYLRTDRSVDKIGELVNMKQGRQVWQTESLYKALYEQDLVTHKHATLELMQGLDASIIVNMHEYGDLPIFISVSGDQIVAEAVLWAVEDVLDTAAFNQCVLRTHKYFPLSTISLETNSLGDEDGSRGYYHMFGALSASSSIDDIVLEIETLADNVINAADAFGSFLKNNVKAAS